MAVHRCAVLDDYQHAAAGAADWSALSPEVAVDFIDRAIPAEERAEALAPYSIVVAMRERTPFDDMPEPALRVPSSLPGPSPARRNTVVQSHAEHLNSTCSAFCSAVKVA